MKCNEIRELMPDLAAGLSTTTSEMKIHLDSCAECAGKLEAFRQTMSLLDEWQAPAPSPYFDVRLRARLREELQKQASGFLQWLRRPALAISFAVLMVVSVTLVRFTGSGSSMVLSKSRAFLQSRARPLAIYRPWIRIMTCTRTSMCS